MSLDGIQTEVSGLRSMVQALRWAESRSPRATFVNAVTQDEFTIDVVVRASEGIYVVFDTT